MCWFVPISAQAVVKRSLFEQNSIEYDLNARRVDTLLLLAMRKAGIDCWIIISREFNQDFVTWYIQDGDYEGGHRNTYIFYEDRSNRLQRIAIGTHLVSGSRVWDKNLSYERETSVVGSSLKPVLRKTVHELDPNIIGVDISRTNPFCDGLTVAMKDHLVEAIGPMYAQRFVPAGQMIVDFLDTSLPEEHQYLKEAAEIGIKIHEEVFSPKCIIPGKTTIRQAQEYINNRWAELGLQSWYLPIIGIIREGVSQRDANMVFQPGDLVTTDIEIIYIGLSTDYQRKAYILKPGGPRRRRGCRKRVQNL